MSLLQRLGIDHLRDRKPTSLSGGETQRVALATMLIAQPHLLLLDEPTTALDSSAQDKLRLILRSLRGRTTVVLTDTQLDVALAVANQIVLLDQGAIIFQGDPTTLLSQLSKFSSTLPVEHWLKAESLFSSSKSSFGHRRLVAKALGVV